MEPPRRFHPHTRKVWEEEIRPIFTDLYLTQGKKLCEIVEMLKGQGFRAEKHHYKTYINKWGLEKNNKETDMVYAAQKLGKRAGKATVFQIRGHDRTIEDVKRYWKRKKLNPAEFPAIPNSPPAVLCRTPSPGADRSGSRPNSPSLEASTRDQSATSADGLDRRLSRPQSISLRTIDPPDSFRSDERALNNASLVFRAILDRSSGHNMSAEEYDRVLFFRQRAFRYTSAIRFKQSSVQAEASWSDAFQLIPTISKCWLTAKGASILLPIALDHLALCRQLEKPDGLKTPSLVDQVTNHMLATQYTPHRLLGELLKAVISSSQSSPDLLERATLIGVDLACGNVHEDAEELSLVLRGLVVNLRIDAQDFDGALQCIQKVHQIRYSRWKKFATHYDLYQLLQSYFHLGYVYRRVGDLQASLASAECGLKLVPLLLFSGDREITLSQFLYLRGRARADRGNWDEAVDDLDHALQLRLATSGAGDYMAPEIAHELEYCLRQQRLAHAQPDTWMDEAEDLPVTSCEEVAADEAYLSAVEIDDSWAPSTGAH